LQFRAFPKFLKLITKGAPKAGGDMKTINPIHALFTAMAMMVAYFIITNPIRSSLYFLMIATIFNGLIIYFILEKSKKQKRRICRKIIPALIIFLFFFSSSVCICNVYPSPITWQPNQQFTHMNFAGSVWITEKRDITVQTSQDIGFNTLRMEHYINGINKGDVRMTRMGGEPLGIPSNFGYNDNETLFQTFNYTIKYMITTENGRRGVDAFPKNVRQKCIQFTSDDFNKLDSDVAVYKLYENGELECWLVGA